MTLSHETRENLIGCTSEEMRRLPLICEEPGYRAREIASWIYRRGAQSFSDMTSLSKDLRSRLAATYTLDRPRLVESRMSRDGTTVKHLFGLGDGRGIEAVEMHEPDRVTVCVSSQVGCAQGCRFCATGQMGFIRNLTVQEIIGQILVTRDGLRMPTDGRHFNLVFMGMGEPLANYDSLARSLRVLNEDFGLGIGRRRITVSTVGLVPEIERLAGEPSPPRLALSLNATTDEVRSRIVPANRRYPISKIVAAIADYRRHTGCRTTLEYVLLLGLNDTPQDADRLSALARQSGSTVNLIQFNPHPGTAYAGLTEAQMLSFRERMLPHAPAVTIRQSKGSDIQAACGQLATSSAARS